LLTGVLHDIRNLLTVPRARVELLVLELERRSLLGLNSKEWLIGELDQVLRSIDAAAAVASSYLGDPGKKPDAEISTQEAAAAIERAVQVLRSDLSLKHVTFGVDLEMPPMAAMGVSAASLFHLILNLARNGAQASDRPHNVQISLKVGSEPTSPLPDGVIQIGVPGKSSSIGRCAALTVTDDASGIEAHLMQRLFREPVSTKSGGTGSGLMFVKYLAAEAAALVRLESAPGRGTAAAVYFRLLEA
jgi:two-component system nitrogen regulation sensor histidine kinase GlnL